MLPLGVSGAHTEPGLPDDAASGETLAGLAVAVPPVASSERTLAVQEAFTANPDLYAIAVVDDDEIPLGIVNRFRFLEMLSRPFGRDLFLHQTIGQAMDPSPLVVDEHTSVETLSGLLTNDKSKYIFDGFIVTRDRKYIGIGTGYSLMRLITERRQTALERLAYYDMLTGLPNRRLFQDRLQQAIASAARNGRRLGVLYLDLDGFKGVNDGLGHTVGDLLLQRAAERFRSIIRAQDTIARISGDEFAFVVSELGTPEDADVVAQKLVDRLGDPFYLDGREVSVSCSIGAAVYPDHGDDPASLLRTADDALYRAKQTRNAFRRYSADMSRSVPSTGSNVFDTVRRAINLSHLEVHYQPQADFRTGRVCALEALVRWRDPARGSLPTLELIRLAEDTGLIGELTDYVCQRALAQLEEWRQKGLAQGVCLTLNVSGIEVRTSAFPSMIRKRTAEAGVPLSALELEIGESALMQSDAAAIDVLSELHRDGVRVSVDDFGTGYSSLARLQRLPIDVVKIDRTFVHRIGRNPKESAMAQAVIVIAHSLDLTVVAEGVETPEQYAFLRANGCDLYQGHLLSPRCRPGTCRDISSARRPR